MRGSALAMPTSRSNRSLLMRYDSFCGVNALEEKRKYADGYAQYNVAFAFFVTRVFLDVQMWTLMTEV